MLDQLEEFVKRTYLFDFYGELLTSRQQEIYSSVIFDDYSISEVAREEGISRQGVHDMICRCDTALENYEAKLHLVDRFLKIRRQVQKIQDLSDADTTGQIRRISSEILEEL